MRESNVDLYDKDEIEIQIYFDGERKHMSA